MGRKFKPSRIELLAERLRLLSNRTTDTSRAKQVDMECEELKRFPDPDEWESWTEYGSDGEEHTYTVVPTACFNCEAGCGILTYLDRETGEVEKVEGNPVHPGSRGKNCGKAPATLNQVKDPERILHPLKRDGPRGSGKWKRVTWDEVLDDVASEMQKLIEDNRGNEITYHVGRPGHEGYMNRVLNAWRVDGHNSHTNICSAGARTGYALWHKHDRPSADFANSDYILLLSAQLESGHYFNPHAQRIMEAMEDGAELAVMDPRLSNTASKADHWLPTQPGSEAAVLLAIAKILLDEDLYDADFLRDWTNWRHYMDQEHPDKEQTFSSFVETLREVYSDFTPEFAAEESGCDPDMIREVARKVGEAGDRFSCHIWRSAATGNLGGWQVSRCLHFLSVLTGSVGTRGGTSPNAWNAFHPSLPKQPDEQPLWDEVQLPPEYPFAHYELSFLLPYFLKEGRGRIGVYFSRVFNPVYTYPDGFSWAEVLRDEDKIGLHVAMTPTWNETAYFADYVLPMGHSPERHDIQSQETHSSRWVAFRQPVKRRLAEQRGEDVEFTYEVNPGEVWEEDEFWMELSWRLDPDGELGIREHFESPHEKGEKMTVDDYYRHVFEHTDGLPEEAAKHGMEPLEYMKKRGAYEEERDVYRLHEEELDTTLIDSQDVHVDEYGTITWTGDDAGDVETIGVMVNGTPRRGFDTPSGRQELYSTTMRDWGWPEEEYTLPHYVRSHVHPDELDDDQLVMVPTFRLPVHIHTRSANSKWLEEIAHRNPVWINTKDAEEIEVETGDLIRVETEIGHFVNRAWVTESIKPGVVGMSHHLGRWRINRDVETEVEEKGNSWGTVEVDLEEGSDGWRMDRVRGLGPFESDDPDSSRIWWRDGGVPQNLAYAPHPDPVSGEHAWHQAVTVKPAGPDDEYGDVHVDTEKSFQIYRNWLEMTRPAPGPDNLRRPKWLKRPVYPDDAAWYMDGPVGRPERWSRDEFGPNGDES